ncbi:uncharacterized protein LOC135494856 isoform X2 [Lineus longissimus]|uniref:uncharacterized protein LOC135494856 isoform X2 n=1 Tax=Lineus longissimus TaxID=88925 RepID=UPI00315DA57D
MNTFRMEEGNLSDADTDELLGLSGIEPFASGASVYLTPSKSPPGSPSDLLASSPKRRPAVNTASSRSPANVKVSPGRGASGHSSPSRSANSSKSPKRAVKKFVDSPGKLKIGDLKGNDEGIRLISSQERLVQVRRYLANQDIVQEGLKVDSQNKENLSNSVGVVNNAFTKINSAPASGVKSSQEIGGIGGKSLPSSPYKVQNVVVTRHHKLQAPPSGISWSDPDAPVSRPPAKPVDPIFTYKRKLFQEDANGEANEKLKNKAVSEKNKKGQAVKDKSNKRKTPNKSSPKECVVHSGSPTQQTHSASKYRVSPRSGEGDATAKSPGKQQRASRSLDNSPDKRPSSIMKGGGSVSPGRRPGPVTFRQSPNGSNSSPKSVSPPKYVKSSPDRVSNLPRHKYTEQSSAYSKTGHVSAEPKSQSGMQHSPEKYEQSFENTPATSGYYSGKSAFTQEGYSNPLDDFLQQYPLSPLRGDTDMSLPGSLPDSPGMKAAAETVPTAEDYDDMPREVYADVTSFDIEEMEGARDSLRTMLKLSTKKSETHLNLGGNNVHDESISSFRSYPEEGYHDEIVTQQNDSFEEVATKALMGSQNEIDYNQALQLTSQLLGREKDVPASALEMENQVLLDNMEREKFRRQHCEKQIGNLQSRLLETQEQLAVATSTEKKKDIMIEQLDKTLSRVVEGWKKREAEKKEYIEVLKGEKEELESRYHSQKDMLEKFDERLQKASKDLESEQRRVAELEESKLVKHEEERQQWAEAIDKERSQREQVEDDHDRTKEGLEHVQGQLDNLQETLNQERSDWSETERNLRKKLADLEVTYKRDMENEKRQVEDQTQLAQETREQLNTTNIDLHKTRLDLETALRERDSLKMEMSLLEARMESSKRQLEADLTSEFEKALSEKMNEAHDRLVSTETDLRESHRKQIQELNQSHREDMEEQMDTMTEDFKKKETYLKEQSKTYEERLEEAQEEIRELKANKHKMELQREREDYHDRYASGERKIEMANRMQSMMQTHCTEALTLLNDPSHSPKKSYQHDSVLSHIPSLANETKSSPGAGADQHPNGISDEGGKVSTKLPLDGAVVVTRPNRVHHDDGAISDVLSTEGDSAMPTYTTSQLIGGVQSTYIPPISLAHLPQQPISDVTCLDSNRSSNFGSASQVTSHYPYGSASYQAHLPVSSYQPSYTYSSNYEPNGQPHAVPYGNGPIRSAFTMTQPPHQPIRNNYTHPAANIYSNAPIGSSYTSQPINSYHNPQMNTSYTNPPIGSQINHPMKTHYLPGQPYSTQSNYNTSSQRPPVLMEDVTKADYSHLYNGNGIASEPSAPSLSSGYSSMANHSSRFGDPMRNGESQLDSGKDESTDMVSLLNGSTATHNDTCVSDISTRMEQHNQRQQELEHYVRMLLGKEPGIPANNGDTKNMVAHSPPQKLEPDSKQTSNPRPGSGQEDSRLVSTAHAPKYGSVMGLAREKLHMKKKGQEDQPAERKSSVRKSRDGPIGKSTTAKPWR